MKQYCINTKEHLNVRQSSIETYRKAKHARQKTKHLSCSRDLHRHPHHPFDANLCTFRI